MQLDREARGLAAFRDGALPHLARTAGAFVSRKCWFLLGYARVGDCARERLGRSGRWLGDLAALDRALGKHPELDRAVRGTDGGPPLRRIAALIIARVARPETIARWIVAGRTLPVRRLKAAAARARAGEDPFADEPEGTADSIDGPADPPRQVIEDSTDPVRLRLAVPRPVAMAFDETLDLFRAISGGDVPLAEFVDALTAEGMASCPPADVELHPAGDLVRDSRREEVFEIASGDWRNLEHGPVGVSLASDDPWLCDFQRLVQDDDGGDAGELLRRLAEWIRLEDEIERRIGRVLDRMGRCGAWHELRFAGPAHYARERLGMGRTAAESRALLARSLYGCPALRTAYEEGRLGVEATLLVRRVLSAGGVDEATERSWVEHAAEVTIRRLRDEVRPFRHARGVAPATAAAAGAGDTMPGLPPTDEQWYASLDRGPGRTARTVASLARGLDLHCVPDVLLSFRLPEDIAQAFRLAIGTACTALEARVAAGLDAMTPSQRVARTFSIHQRRVPSWVGLLWLMEDFLATWDPPEDLARSRRSDAVYRRAGWRCEAPGCTSRSNLEDHHVVYRSHGGSNALHNRNCMCRCHHGPGQHGGLISVSGTAPLGLLWRLGAPRFAAWYRNDRRLRGPAGVSGMPASVSFRTGSGDRR